MTSAAFALFGVRLTWAAVIAAVALLQFLVAGTLALARRPQRGAPRFRLIDQILIGSSALLVGGWMLALTNLSSAGTTTHVAAASAMASSRKATTMTCGSVRLGMRKDEVVSGLGTPDETRSEEETRGPGAEALLYRDSRCAVHVFAGLVESVD